MIKLRFSSFYFIALSAFLLSACQPLIIPAQISADRYDYKACRQMAGRGVISLDERRKCQLGLPFVRDGILQQTGASEAVTGASSGS